MVLTVTSDLMRFAYLLAKDAWKLGKWSLKRLPRRADAFEAYRRLLVGDAWKELDAGELYTHSWSQGLSRSQRTADFIFQCMLHLSLETWLVFFFFFSFLFFFLGLVSERLPGVSPPRTWPLSLSGQPACSWRASAGCTHVMWPLASGSSTYCCTLVIARHAAAYLF